MKNFYYKFITDFYILSEFLKSFLFSLIIFIFINISSFVLFNVINLIVDYGINLKQASILFILSIPEMLFYSIPMSSLLASLFSVSNLNKNNELIIMLLSGKNKFYIFKSLIFFSFLLFTITFIFNNFIVSKSSYNFNNNIKLIQNNYNYSFYKENFLYKEIKNGVLNKSIYVGKIENNNISNVFIEYIKNNKVIKIISSKKAILYNDFMILKYGEIIIFQDNSISKIKFQSYKFNLNKALKNIIFEKREAKEMTYTELKDFINNLKKTGNNYYNYEVQLYQKISLPFSIIIFTLIGISIGSINNKSKSFNFSFSIIFIFLYYVLMFISSLLGNLGYINTLIAAWLPNLIVFFLNLLLFLL
ncbi:MAG: permease [Candidatus Sericytochromatia bacterium]|nr:MAG: permease [Candidatus Sericytochromatia bacterium]